MAKWETESIGVSHLHRETHQESPIELLRIHRQIEVTLMPLFRCQQYSSSQVGLSELVDHVLRLL